MGLFGKNGSGKSTLLKLMYGTLNGGSVKMSIDKVLIRTDEVIPKQLIAYLPQHPFLPRRTLVRDVIPMYYTEQQKQDAIFYDPFVATFTNNRINELSIGQQRYLALHLLSQLPHPFLLLDEPLSMIDPLQKEPLKELMHKVKLEKGVIVTDHYYNDVLDITTKNIVLKEGISHPISSEEDLAEMGYLRKRK